MTPIEEQMRALLRDATPEPVADVRFDAVAAKVRERRRARSIVTMTAVAVALLVAGAGAVAVRAITHQPTLIGRGPTAAPTPSGSPAPSSSSILALSGRSVNFQGVQIRLPVGWTVGTGQVCGFPPDRTVALPPPVREATGCPMMNNPNPVPRSLSLSPIVTWDSGVFWSGTQITWHGQPARVVTRVSRGATQVNLWLPWLNAMVESTAGNRSTAMAQLDAVAVAPGSGAGLGVPATADAVEVEYFPALAVAGQTLRGHVTRPPDVAALLSDLRGGTRVTDPASACGGGNDDPSAVLTVRSGESFRTFFAIFGGCGLVVGNTGVAARTVGGLQSDIERLAPVLQPHSDGSRPYAGCTSAGVDPPPAGTAGPSTRQGALRTFLAPRPAGYPADPGSWYEVDAGIFISGYAMVAVEPLPGPGQGYYLAYQSNC